MSYSQYNNLTVQLNKAIKKTGPSLRTIGKWREEWISTGHDKKMTFEVYKSTKLKQWKKEKHLKKSQTK